jgi:hypothetical protein
LVLRIILHSRTHQLSIRTRYSYAETAADSYSREQTLGWISEETCYKRVCVQLTLNVRPACISSVMFVVVLMLSSLTKAVPIMVLQNVTQIQQFLKRILFPPSLQDQKDTCVVS